ncbi:uncharacterized protein MYCFIDRAFT_175607 [Pseudocercospora fijiensis CIRAD86]|uniref:Uncharacterized protein n=1 Tax=Pseudocercospora fijiensis (strain CIRAD86) TaxID=383855 RepID=M2ZSR7_PSEFD|nr:uncharacterized protein MYCFIDRAFT_175607 [Pseudocercospora fijiensis CIRAD86]EME82059.1 hypothetical protein MYCFIDRAFT_175607 [Pseudocercospora fijiensis CIRAD86]
MALSCRRAVASFSLTSSLTSDSSTASGWVSADLKLSHHHQVHVLEAEGVVNAQASSLDRLLDSWMSPQYQMGRSNGVLDCQIDERSNAKTYRLCTIGPLLRECNKRHVHALSSSPCASSSSPGLPSADWSPEQSRSQERAFWGNAIKLDFEDLDLVLKGGFGDLKRFLLLTSLLLCFISVSSKESLAVVEKKEEPQENECAEETCVYYHFYEAQYTTILEECKYHKLRGCSKSKISMLEPVREAWRHSNLIYAKGQKNCMLEPVREAWRHSNLIYAKGQKNCMLEPAKKIARIVNIQVEFWAGSLHGTVSSAFRGCHRGTINRRRDCLHTLQSVGNSGQLMYLEQLGSARVLAVPNQLHVVPNGVPSQTKGRHVLQYTRHYPRENICCFYSIDPTQVSTRYRESDLHHAI